MRGRATPTAARASKRFENFFGRLADPQDYEGTGKAQHQDAGGCDGDEIY